MKCGDKVLIVPSRVGANWASDMYQYFGKIMTVDVVCYDGVRMFEDTNRWYWNNYMIEKVVDV